MKCGIVWSEYPFAHGDEEKLHEALMRDDSEAQCVADYCRRAAPEGDTTILEVVILEAEHYGVDCMIISTSLRPKVSLCGTESGVPFVPS